MKVLCVIDMQNDFIDGALGTAEAVAIVDNVRDKINLYRKNGDMVIFTRDTHAENYMETSEGKNLPVPHCIKGSYGWLISDKLEVGESTVIDKPTFGSIELSEYIAGLDMSVFVYDYDHNAPTKEHLAETHYPFYKTVREKNPTLPIICINAHNARPSRLHDERRLIILDTYNRARAEGDENVYFIDGDLLFPEDIIANCTVDGCHPNDLGFYFMAKSIAPLIKELLEK